MGQGRKGEPTRIGIIGCGIIAENHIRAVRRLTGVQVVAVCDRNTDVAEALARKHRVSSIYADIAAMLAEERLDAVHITTPPRTHTAICRMTLQNGCHVLVEKPAALTVAELDALLDLARTNAVTLSTVHNGLFQRALRRALLAVRSGAIGELRSVHIADHIPFNYEIVNNPAHWCHALPGGIYGEMLPHDIYLADALVPDLKLDSVTTHGSGRYSWLPVEQVLASLSSRTACLTIHASVDGGNWNKAIDITGTAGSIRVDRMCDVVTSSTATTDWTLRAHVQRVSSHVAAWMQQTGDTAAAKISRQPQSGHDLLIRQFYSSIRQGEALPVSAQRMRQTALLYEDLTGAIDSRARVS